MFDESTIFCLSFSIATIITEYVCTFVVPTGEDYFHYFAFLRFEPLADRAYFNREIANRVKSSSTEAHEEGDCMQR
jgi:hypothetical protein